MTSTEPNNGNYSYYLLDKELQEDNIAAAPSKDQEYGNGRMHFE